MVLYSVPNRKRCRVLFTAPENGPSAAPEFGPTCGRCSIVARLFDSSTERDLANVLEDEDAITLWVRLQIGDLPILWTGAGREYNPDFIAVDRAEVHWVIEVKMDKEMANSDVQGKRDAARRWANHVSADEKVGAVWRYMLLSESDIAMTHGTWAALEQVCGYGS
jgi:type III restriction enzyme